MTSAAKTAPAATPTAGGRLSSAYLLVVVTAILLSQALPVPVVLEDTVYSAISLSVVAAILVGIRRHRPHAAGAWYLIAVGQGCWFVADTLYGLTVVTPDQVPSPADAFYLLGYPFLVLGLVLMVRGRALRHEWGALLDSATVTAGLCLVSWVVLARPTIESFHDSIWAASVAAAYPAMDIVLVGGLVRLVTEPGSRSRAFHHLLASLMLLVAADSLSVAADLYAADDFALADSLWLLSYAAFGAAALHPSMATLSDPATRLDVRVRGPRLMAVLVATLLVPALLAIHQVTGFPIDMWAVIVGGVVMVTLVIVRLNLFIQEIASAHRALEKLQDELAVQATQDALTGLANRTQAMRLLAAALGRARRRGGTVALLFIDLDHFKEVNDEFGHRAGDRVLQEVAARMREQIRDGDFAARLGGDEFVVGIEDVTDEREPLALARRLIDALSREIVVGEHQTARIGASVGVALGRGGETSVESLLHDADLAVYRAKADGRGRSQLFDGQAREELQRRNEIERALAQAMANDDLVLHFQPIVHLGTGQVEGHEVLVRWNRPGSGLLGPDDFLPVAEASDLVCELDVWVLRAAVAQLERWNRMRGDQVMQIAVNISGRHISQRRIVDDVAAALREAAVIAPQLVIEVTETAVMDGPAAAANLELLRAMGLVVSLDDFGTGYQSNSQLSRLPVDVLKVDRQFVQADTDAARSLLELMIRTGQAYGARVVAEGVEHAGQLALVRQLGCEYAQGHHLGRPVPAHEVTVLDTASGALAG